MSSIINADTTNGLVLTSDTSGEIKLQSGGTDIATVSSTGIAMASGKSISGAGAGGKILQVVNTTFGTYVNTSSSTFSDLGLSATITPSSTSSKILVTVFLTGAGKNVGNTSGKFKLLRNSTDILVFEGILGYNNGSAGNYASTGTTYLDSPSTTSSITYKIQFASTTNINGVYVNDFTASPTGNSTMTLMEVAG